MAANVEIKARVRDPEALRARTESLTGTPAELIPQEDIFFRTGEGRLKLRVLAPDRGQLIYYERQNQSGPKRSDYQIADTSDPAALKNVLADALGVRGIVRKERQLYWVGNTRIHLDEVEGLGTFMELEVVLQAGQSTREGEARANELMALLRIEQADLVEGAYIDLMERQAHIG